MGVILSRLWTALFRSRPRPLFRYQSSLDDRSIRLLRFVRPRWFTFGLARPKLLIATYPFDKVPKYVGLSHTWGPPHQDQPGYDESDKLPILLNDQHFFVLPNLLDGLHDLRKVWNFDDEVQHMWIDAICIDQANLSERAAQVEMMGQIYTRASQTVVWLGKSNQDTAAAMRMYQSILDIPAEDFAPFYKQYPNVIPPSDEFWRTHGLPSLQDERSWAPLIRLFESRWFSRAWVIQEITLASRAIVLWGSHTMSWESLGHVALAGRAARLGQLEAFSALTRYLSGDTEHASKEDWVVHDSSANIFQLWINKYRYAQGDDRTVDEALVNEMKALTGCRAPSAASWLVYFSLTNRWADATDPRDKVYGYLGLVTDIMKRDSILSLPIHATYSPTNTVSQVYKQVTKLLVEETDTLAVLMAINDPPSLRQASLPSWVPDFSRRQGLDFMWTVRPQFCASGDPARLEETPHRIEGTRRVQIDGNQLRARGSLVGTVVTLSASLSDFMGPRWHVWIQHLLAVDPIYRFTEECRVEAFWRTLLMDSQGRQYPAEKGTGDMFRAYVLQCLARYFPGLRPESEQYRDYVRSIQAINLLSATDTSGSMPSYSGPSNIIAQAARIPDKEVESLSGEEITTILTELVDKMAGLLMGMDGSMVNRRIAFSDQGHFMNIPMWAEAGDVIAVLDSCPCPLVLRALDQKLSCYTIQGSAYVHGVMYGEAVNNDTQWEQLCIQ